MTIGQTGLTNNLTRTPSTIDTTIYVDTPPTNYPCRLRLFSEDGKTQEWLKATAVGTITSEGDYPVTVERDMNLTASPSTASGTGQSWWAGAEYEVVAMHDEMTNTQGDNTFSGDNTFTGNNSFEDVIKPPRFVNIAARDAAFPIPEDGQLAIVAGDLWHYNGTTAQWEIADTGTPLPNAGEALAGKVELATLAEQGNQTETGGSSANVVIQAKNTVKTPSTYTPAFLTGGTSAQSNFVLWAVVTDGSFRITIDSVAYNIDAISFVGDTDIDDVALTIQTAIRTATGSLETVVWSTDHFIISSGNTTSSSAITVTITSTGTVGTDISGAGASDWLDCDTGNGIVTNAVLDQTQDENKVILANSDGKINTLLVDTTTQDNAITALQNKITKSFLAGENIIAGNVVRMGNIDIETETISQTQENNKVMPSDDYLYVAQTFLTTADVKEIKNITIRLQRVDGGTLSGNFIVSLRESSGGFPTGGNISGSTTVVDVDTISTAETDYDYDMNVSVSPNTTYAIVIDMSALTSSGGNYLNIFGQEFSVYANGQSSTSNDNVNWATATVLRPQDLYFKVVESQEDITQIYKTNSNANEKDYVGVANETKLKGESTSVDVIGINDNQSISASDVGKLHYLASSGAIATSGTYEVGTALSTTELRIK